MCGLFLWGSSWWIFPLVGVLMCLGFLILAFRFASMGRGCRGMDRHYGMRNHNVAGTRE